MHQFLIRTMLASTLMLFAGTLPAHPATPPNAQAVPASASALQLRWSVVRNVFSAERPRGRSLARLALTNLGEQPLQAQGWALYFNSMDGVQTGAVGGGMVLEPVSGQLFRLRPAAGFAGLAPGATLDIDYFHRVVLINTDMVPKGPYLVFDSHPEKGHAIANYRIDVMTRPEQLDTGSADPLERITAQMSYARNAATADLPSDALAAVFPTPVRAERLPGSLHLSAMPRIVAAPALRREAALARELLAGHFPPSTKPTSVLQLRVGKIEGHNSPEAYLLAIDPQAGISLTGATPAAVFRGLQSLRELMPPVPGGAVALPALRLVDAPRFPYRGFQLDVARNFQSKETVFRLLDQMARYKLNKFHFHLTDDEGWRLEIAGLPELTAFGARRGHTLSVVSHLQPAYGSGPQQDDPHGSGYYSRADYIAILRYAAARHIDVIPELEMPGHARAAVKAMESRQRRLAAQGKPNASQYLLNEYLLSDPADRSVYSSPQLYNDNVLNPGMSGTYAFVERVIGDVVAMHKEAGVMLRTIHVGGDELPDGAWENSPASLATMKRLKLASSADLWDHFYDRVDGMLKKHGLFASGWEELGARKTRVDGKTRLIPNPIFRKRGFNVFVWNNLNDAQDLAYRLANAGYGTVLAPVTNMYFDMAHNKNADEPGVHWGAYIELDTVWEFDPLDFLKHAGVGKERLTDVGKANILGLEATLFTETVRERARLDYLTMPRMLALAERAWARAPAWTSEPDPAAAARLRAHDWALFANQLGKRVLPRLDAERNGVAYRIAPPGLALDQGRVLANHQLPGFTLRYTNDGSEPHGGSAVVRGPIDSKGLIRVTAFAANGRAGAAASIDNP